MRRLLRKNRHLRKRLTKAKERIIEIIQLFSAATLQQMNKEKKKKENEKNDKCRREVDGEREDEKNCEKEIFEKEKESRYNDVRSRRREGPECNDFHEISHR